MKKSATKKIVSSLASGARKATNGAASKRSHANSSKSNSPSEGLKKIFEDELKDIYWAEKHLTKALPKMAKASSSEELQEVFEDHLEQTHEQIKRLEQVFEICNIKVQAKKCEAMEGLVEESQEIINENEKGVVRDTALIIAGQKVEHYEIAAYGSLRTLAQVLRFNDAVDLLQTTLDEEGEADKLLTSISQTINQRAMDQSAELGVESEEEELA
jgi:ferritin-like metal-binding protein YciE